MLEIKNVSKNFGQKTALDDVSFTVQRGRICGLLGLNGAGKSTLMKIICRLAFADKGEILINGKRNVEGELSSVGAMIEAPAFYRELSGRQNLKMLSTLYPGVTDADINNAMNVCGLIKSVDIAVKKYSLGMKQRLYFAYALMKKSNVFILDEPFNGIDPVTIKNFRNTIKTLEESGCTILISGHVISELQKICKDIVIIDSGKIVYCGENKEGEDLEKLFLSFVSNSGEAQ